MSKSLELLLFFCRNIKEKQTYKVYLSIFLERTIIIKVFGGLVVCGFR